MENITIKMSKYRKQLFVTDPDGIQTEHVKAN